MFISVLNKVKIHLNFCIFYLLSGQQKQLFFLEGFEDKIKVTYYLSSESLTIIIFFKGKSQHLERKNIKESIDQ